MSKSISITYLIIIVITLIIGYLELQSVGLVWGLLVWLTSYIGFIPIIGPILYMYYILSWIHTTLGLTNLPVAMSVMEMIWIVISWIKTIPVTALLLLIMIKGWNVIRFWIMEKLGI